MRAWRKYKPYKDMNQNILDEEEVKDEDQPVVKPKKESKFRRVVGGKLVKEIINGINKTMNDDEFDKMDLTSHPTYASRPILDDGSDESVEEELLINFLARFLLTSNTRSNNIGEVNLTHALRALPKRINESNFDRIELMNLSVIQMSIISFQNDDKDELFNFYDRRSKSRLQRLRKSTMNIALEMNNVLDRLRSVLSKTMRTFGHEASEYSRTESDETYLDKSDSASDFL